MLNWWWIFAILQIVGWVGYAQFIKKATAKSNSDVALTILTCSVAGLVAIAFIPFVGWSWPSSTWSWVMVLASCTCYAVSDWLNTKTRRGLEVSIVSIVNQISTVMTMLFGAMVFSEEMTLMKILGALMIVGGNVFVMYRGGKWQWNKYVGLAVLANFLMAGAAIVDIAASESFSLPFYITLTSFGPALLLTIFGGVGIRGVVKEFRDGNKGAIVLSGLAFGVAILAGLRAYQLGAVSTVAPVLATSTIINILIAYFFAGEKDNLARKLIAAGVILIGVILVNLGSV